MRETVVPLRLLYQTKLNSWYDRDHERNKSYNKKEHITRLVIQAEERSICRGAKRIYRNE